MGKTIGTPPDSEHDDQSKDFTARISEATPSSLARYIQQHELNYRPGQRVLIESFGETIEDDPFCSENSHEIHMQMALYSNQSDTILSCLSIFGKHLAGGIMVLLDPSKTMDCGDVCVISYHVRDDYTVTYAKYVQDSPESHQKEVTIIAEIGMLNIDEICPEFTSLTGVELPYAST